MSTYAISLPIRTVSEANAHEHYWNRAKRAKQQHKTVVMYCNEIRGRGIPKLVRLTRIGKRDLDWQDNLNISFKHVRDALAKLCGFNDRERSIKWEYDQRRPNNGEEIGIRVEIEWDDARADVVKPPLPKPMKCEADQGKLFCC